jgi:hypothetical protein
MYFTGPQLLLQVTQFFNKKNINKILYGMGGGLESIKEIKDGKKTRFAGA